MSLQRLRVRYTSLDRGWRACVLAMVIVIVESIFVTI